MSLIFTTGLALQSNSSTRGVSFISKWCYLNVGNLKQGSNARFLCSYDPSSPPFLGWKPIDLTCTYWVGAQFMVKYYWFQCLFTYVIVFSPVRLFPLTKTILVVKECTSSFFVCDWQVDGLLAGNIPKVYVAVWLEQDLLEETQTFMLNLP